MDPIIEIRGANVTLGGHPVLRDISWQLNPGEQWVIVGANGSGKSTFLRLVRGDQWLDPGSGSRIYRLNGEASTTPVGMREKIGYVSPEQQERYIRLDFGLTGRTAIETGFFNTDYLFATLDDAQRARVDEIIALLDIGDLAGKNLTQMSQGELRKILIARALVHAPRVLLLDEVGSGLDRASREGMLELLDRIAAAGTQIVLVTHRSTERLRATTHELRLRGGRIASSHPVDLAHGMGPVRRAVRRTAHAPAAHPAFLIKISNADVFLDGEPVLHHINWEVGPGEQWAILGPNGSGKSTLAKLAAGLLHPAYGGTVRHFGSSRPLHLWELKRRIAFLSDEMQTGYDQDIPARNVIGSGFFSSVGLYGRLNAAQQQTIDELVERFALQRLVERPFLRLSFGERRKILLARALVRRPEIAFVDEAANGLDPVFRSAFMTLLDELARAGTTLVVISHHEDDLPAAVTHELWMEGGRIVRQTRVEDEATAVRRRDRS